MADSIITTNGKKTILYRAYTENADLSSTQYLAPTKFKIGVDNADPVIGDENLLKPIPIAFGTICDTGENTFTGSSGGEDSTDNVTVYKSGGGIYDNTGQNLITNTSSVDKVWTISDLSSAGNNCDSTEYIGLSIYIKDASALAKFASSGTALEIRIGVDSTTNYYEKTLEAADLVVGWNWISDNGLLSDWTENGTPGTLNDFQIRITTNNASDSFVAGDVVFDLLRQWTDDQSTKLFSAGYPSFDLDSLEVTYRAYLNTLESNGFLINALGIMNQDTIPLMTAADTFTGESKSNTDEIIFTAVDRII